jgi:hypothetical protein
MLLPRLRSGTAFVPLRFNNLRALGRHPKGATETGAASVDQFIEACRMS